MTAAELSKYPGLPHIIRGETRYPKEDDAMMLAMDAIAKCGRFPDRGETDLAEGATSVEAYGDWVRIELYPITAVNAGLRPVSADQVHMMGDINIRRSYSDESDLFYIGLDGYYYRPGEEGNPPIRVGEQRQVALDAYLRTRVEAQE